MRYHSEPIAICMKLSRLPAERVTTLVSDWGIATPEKKMDMTTTDVPITRVTAPAGGRSGPVELLRRGSLGEPRRLTRGPAIPTDSFTRAGALVPCEACPRLKTARISALKTWSDAVPRSSRQAWQVASRGGARCCDRSRRTSNQMTKENCASIPAISAASPWCSSSSGRN